MNITCFRMRRKTNCLAGWRDRLRGYVGEQAKRFFKIELSKLSRYEPINRCKDMNSPIFFVPPGYHAGQEKSASLQVVLVANRIDSRDEERMNERDNSLLLKTRLSGAVLNEKLSSSNITESERKHLQLWFLTSRLVFWRGIDILPFSCSHTFSLAGAQAIVGSATDSDGKVANHLLGIS